MNIKSGTIFNLEGKKYMVIPSKEIIEMTFDGTDYYLIDPAIIKPEVFLSTITEEDDELSEESKKEIHQSRENSKKKTRSKDSNRMVVRKGSAVSNSIGSIYSTGNNAYGQNSTCGSSCSFRYGSSCG